MPYDIGARVGIDGEREFRSQISRINKDYKSMESYLQTLDKSMERNGKSMETLSARHNGLQQQLALQEKKHKELEQALEKVRQQYDAGSQEVLRFEGALLDVDQTMADLRREIADTEDDMDKLANGIEDVGDAAEDADDKVLGFGDMLKAELASGAILNVVEEVGEAIVAMGRESVTAAADVRASNSQFSQTFRELEGTARAALDGISEEIKISTSRLQGSYTALYAFTKNVGGDTAQALNIAQRATRAAADSAAYYDRTVEDATETLQSFLKGNYENDAALGIAATETTRNAKANELYAKSFKELSEAQKVDVLLSMVEAGNAASGALGAAAREADEWTNVTGELTEAWHQMLVNLGNPILEGVTPILRGINEQLNALLEPRPIHLLNDGIESFRVGIQSATDALNEGNASIAAQAALAQRYLDHLRELEGAGLDTAESQREYAQTVELLNEIMPALNLTIDEHTGLLDQDTGAIEDNIRSLKKQAEQQAKMAYYQDIMSGYEDAYKKRFAAEKALVALQTEELELSKRLTAAREEYEAAEGEARNAAYNRFLMAQADYNINIAHQRELKDSLAELNAELEEHGALLDEATQETSDLSGAEQEAADSSAALAQAQDELSDAYAAAESAARESIDQQIGLFDKLTSKSELSKKQIIKNWESQQKAFLLYADNLQKAMDMGLDETLVRQLADGSQQSMQILNELVNGSGKSVEQINAAFAGLNEAKDTAAHAMAEMEDSVMDALGRMEAAAAESGGDIVDGAAGSIIKNIPVYEAALDKLAKRGQRKFEEAWVIHSPSRWMADASDDIVDGGVNQVQQRIRDMERSMEDLAHSGQVAYQRQLAAEADSYPAVTAGAVGYTTNSTTNNHTVSLGGVTVVVNAQQGQDTTALAYEVAHVLNTMYEQEVNAIG